MVASVTGVGQIAICVENINTSLHFYRDIIGLPFLFAPNDKAAFLQCGDTRLMLSTPQGAGEPGKNSVIYLRVHHIESVFHDIQERGAETEQEPTFVAKLDEGDLWMAFIRDPEGNLIGLMEDKPSAKP